MPQLLLVMHPHHQLRHQPIEAGIRPVGQGAQRIMDQALTGNVLRQRLAQGVIGSSTRLG